MAKIDGMRELESMIKKLGKVPQSAATKSARAGATIALRSAKANAPVDDGDLKQGLILKQERRRVQGKAVYNVMVSPHWNDKFVKVSKDGKRSYYPASMEYGFMTVDGGFVPGHRYFRRSLDDNKSAIERKVLEVAGKEVDKALRG